ILFSLCLHGALPILLYTCALLSRALVGIQPQFRHTPPSSDFSTMAVFIPFCAAFIAATYPPGPLPITTTSYCILSCFKLSYLPVSLWPGRDFVPSGPQI